MTSHPDTTTPPPPPPPLEIVWAAIVGDTRSGWWAGRRLYDDNGKPLTRRQTRRLARAEQ